MKEEKRHTGGEYHDIIEILVTVNGVAMNFCYRKPINHSGALKHILSMLCYEFFLSWSERWLLFQTNKNSRNAPYYKEGESLGHQETLNFSDVI